MEGNIKLAHGNGGRYSRELMESCILPYFTNPELDKLHDGALLSLGTETIAFTTDSYVVTPRFFPGGSIGDLAVCGTVNDLTMTGATPKYLSCSFILEEGLSIADFKQILAVMAERAKEAKVTIVTGDTKVVEKEAVDGIYINTAGVGAVPKGLVLSPQHLEGHEDIILTGSLGDHAIAVMGTRFGLQLPSSIATDSAPLNGMLMPLVDTHKESIKVMRDPTRGGLGSTLCELAQEGHVGILIEEEALPIHEDVLSVCHILGYDPLYLANEGKGLLFVDPSISQEVLQKLQEHPYGREARLIGHTMKENKGKVAMRTLLGGIRMIEPLGEDQVPRIC